MYSLTDERYDLAKTRIGEIINETAVPCPYREFFGKEASFLYYVSELYEQLSQNADHCGTGLKTLQERNKKLYEDILPENYEKSFGNPAYACEVLGDKTGTLFSFLYAELRGAVVFAFEGRKEALVILMELFIRVYVAYSDEDTPGPEILKLILREYCNDYCADFTKERVRELIDPDLTFAADIIMNSDLNDPRYLYSFGEYVSDNEIKTAELLAGMSEEEIEKCASVYTQGYRTGFEVTGKDLSKKKTVNIRYCLGFERIVRCAVQQFEKMGLKPVIYRNAVRSNDSWSPRKSGYYSSSANPQYDYDHRNDYALYLNDEYVTRKLQALDTAFREMKEKANTHAGPACIEVFGEKDFEPEEKKEAFSPDEAQRALLVKYRNESAAITNRYIIAEERSFTIIAYPLPEIGPDYEEIFKETVRLNNLDYKLYRDMQQIIIDALDKSAEVVIKGKEPNETCLRMKLHKLDDPGKQTNFENCVADVNIPVGEVFTSPVLSGTDGLLHVSRVYIGGLRFKDLKIEVRDGMVSSYTCANSESEEDNKTLILENIMFSHGTLPMGEFAIGTNTTAFEMGRRFGIEDKLPILISEKTGPHFAFGDTCYSWEEDVRTFNPDGKEIIAKENECSALRKTDVNKAYFGCHTDITIPYDEIGYIKAVTEDKKEITIIENGRFVLPGTEVLNEPLEKLGKAVCKE